MDYFYASVELFRDLEKKMLGGTGTIKKNCKGLPLDIKTKKLLQGESALYQFGTLTTIKDVYVITNFDYGKSL